MTIMFGSTRLIEDIGTQYNIKNKCIGVGININTIFLFLIGKVLGLETIMWWVGTDVLKYNTIWHWRLRYNLFKPFIDKNYVISEWLSEELLIANEIKPIKPGWIHYDDTLLQTKG